MSEVVCAGIVVVDHVAAPVDHMPAAGELMLTSECKLAIGGCASNTAVDLCKMGRKAALAGLVGNDSFGQFARDTLESAGVETATLSTTEESATSQTLIVNVKNEDRRYIHHIGANRLFGPKHIPWDSVKKAKVLYIGGFFLMGMTGSELAEIFCEAKRVGVATVLDVVTPSGGVDHLAELTKALPHADVFLPNFDEAKLITGAQDPFEQAESLQALGARTVVITLGHEGAVVVSRNERLRVGTYPTDFVDGTGSGDAFDAGFICGMLEDAPLRRCLELGTALGSSCVRKTGATQGVFNREEANAFIEANTLAITSA